MRTVVAAALLLGCLLASVISARDEQKLSEVEQLKHQLLLTQAQLSAALERAAPCDAQARSKAVQDAATALKVEIEKAHPGTTFDLNTGQLVKKEEK